MPAPIILDHGLKITEPQYTDNLTGKMLNEIFINKQKKSKQ